MMRSTFTLLMVCALACGWTPRAFTESGYELWLRYEALDDAARASWSPHLRAVVNTGEPSPVRDSAVEELRNGLRSLLGAEVPEASEVTDGAIVFVTPRDDSPLVETHVAFDRLGDEGYAIHRSQTGPFRAIVIAANSDTGLLYGAFALLRIIQTGGTAAGLDTVSVPAMRLRLLNHWDNLDRTVERGYAGQSIWDWWRLPELIDPRYGDYARANASVGINGAVLNNVNAQAEILTDRYLEKVAAIAGELRPWGMRPYLSVRFSAPVDLGGLDTADPLDPGVRAWWRDMANAIYRRIPDFGGFLVKANSEGQPGPQDYGRSHADGANMLAAALRPHGGVVMWRAFVYSAENPEDRVKQAFSEFRPLDGRFADNVMLQVKNGPLDFQPREPFHPLFGAMPETPLMLELQITKEYLGFSTHLAYLGTMWEEVLDADTQRSGPGSTVAGVIDGSLHGQRLTGIAGVANTGSDRDWSGSQFDQANWYAFGRLAWDPRLDARDIAEEWLRMTFSRDPAFVEDAADLMMRSRQAVVDYMTPLGLAHLMGTGHHYGPAPWVDDLSRPEWNPYYYHRADAEGIGIDRTASGTGAVKQYAPPLAEAFSDLDSVPEKYLLWFHRLPWKHEIRPGMDVWEALVKQYDRGVAAAEEMRAAWRGLRSHVDPERFRDTAARLDIQVREARWWRDASLAYFMERSGRELPEGVRPPARSLKYYRELEFPYAPGH